MKMARTSKERSREGGPKLRAASGRSRVGSSEHSPATHMNGRENPITNRGSAGIHGKNPDLGLTGQAPPIVHEALHSPGQPLDGPTRSFFEARFGHDFSKVRVHSDDKAAASARAIDALAYTVGQDVVFAPGQYSPRARGGQQLLAHELAHVIQQDGVAEAVAGGDRLALIPPDHTSEREASSAAGITGNGWNPAGSRLEIVSRELSPVIQRAPAGWSTEYDEKNRPEPMSFLRKPYQEFKSGLGEVRPTTKGGLSQNLGRPIHSHQGAGIPAAPEITMPVLKEIYPSLAADVAADTTKTRERQATAYLDSLNQAFRIMKIDTVEAQANYLAHAFVESGQFRAFTETQASVDKGAHTWVDDPTKVPVNKASLPKDKDVNPFGNFEFIGRGPVQVTHRPEYVETIAMLEKTAEQYDKEAAAGNMKARSSAQLAHEAADAIKADPRQAANPKYAFLFSAAFMKKRGADVTVAYQGPGTPWTGTDAASSWVAGGAQKKGSPQAQALIDKSNAYTHIYSVLLREAKKVPKAGP